MTGKVIFETEDKQFRIMEFDHLDVDLDMLKGEVFSAKVNPDVNPEKLEKEEREFETLVESEGVFGYALQRWNPKPGQGYETIDSCWGFVGRYSPNDARFCHYIVDELKTQIKVWENKNEN